MSKDTGGPAFPFSPCDMSTERMQAQGMTLRDWFAGKALGPLAGVTQTMTHVTPEMVSEECYRYADAMIAEMNKP